MRVKYERGITTKIKSFADKVRGLPTETFVSGNIGIRIIKINELDGDDLVFIV